MSSLFDVGWLVYGLSIMKMLPFQTFAFPAAHLHSSMPFLVVHQKLVVFHSKEMKKKRLKITKFNYSYYPVTKKEITCSKYFEKGNLLTLSKCNLRQPNTSVVVNVRAPKVLI
jgi:hypothetical protein